MLDFARKRLPQADFRTTGGENLPFEDNSFDLVVATGILHHVAFPRTVIREMLRVAKTALLVSDHNDFAMGPTLKRRLRLALYAAGLLPLYQRVTHFGRRIRFSNEDGWYYPYSLLNDFDLFVDHSRDVIIVPTRIRGRAELETLMLRQSHLGIICFEPRIAKNGQSPAS